MLSNRVLVPSGGPLGPQARGLRDRAGLRPVGLGDSPVVERRRLVLVDASDDHAQAIELFSQSVARLGSRRVAVYTERMHEGLELFVRTQGAWLLLGPLNNRQWEEFFSSMLPPARRGTGARQSPGGGPRKRSITKKLFQEPNRMPRKWPPESVLETSSNP